MDKARLFACGYVLRVPYDQVTKGPGENFLVRVRDFSFYVADGCAVEVFYQSGNNIAKFYRVYLDQPYYHILYLDGDGDKDSLILVDRQERFTRDYLCELCGDAFWSEPLCLCGLPSHAVSAMDEAHMWREVNFRSGLLHPGANLMFTVDIQEVLTDARGFHYAILSKRMYKIQYRDKSTHYRNRCEMVSREELYKDYIMGRRKAYGGS